MEEYTTRLKMTPICNCGYIFGDGIIINESIVEINGLEYKKYSIEPSRCPSCRKKIDCIENYRYIREIF